MRLPTELNLEHIEDYIRFFWDENGFAPTVREIGKGCGYDSTATVQHYLDQLREQGRISWQSGRARTIRLASG